MSTNKSFLALMFDSPLMSWGGSSRFRRRLTLLNPTRGAISGMICAALGADRGSKVEEEWLQRLFKMKLKVMAIPRLHSYDKKRKLPVVRLNDFQTVGAGYDKDDPWQKDMMVHNAEGKPRESGIKHRQYLANAQFGVLMEGDSDHLRIIGEALQNPCWGLWFGCKSCIPSSPIFRGLKPTLKEALECLELSEDEADKLSSVSDVDSFSEGNDTVMDVPLNFKTRSFSSRRILRKHST